MRPFLLLIAVFALTLVAGRLAYPRFGYWSWSPVSAVIVLAGVLFVTGHLDWQ